MKVIRHILEKKRVDLGNKFNFGSMMFWVVVVFAIVAGTIGIASVCNKEKKKKIIKPTE